MKKLLLDPGKRIITMMILSIFVHGAFLVKWPHGQILSRQIMTDLREGDITLINYTRMGLKWDAVEPVVRIKSDAGEIPVLFERKEPMMDKGDARHETGSESESVSLSAEVLEVRETYETGILKRIHRMKYYPLSARRIGNEGKVTLRFTLNKQGTLKGPVEIVAASGYEILNNAGITTIRNANPYPAFPYELAKLKDEITFIVNVEYSLRAERI